MQLKRRLLGLVAVGFGLPLLVVAGALSVTGATAGGLLQQPLVAWGAGLAILSIASALLWQLHRLRRQALVPINAITDQIASAGQGQFISLHQPDVDEWVPLARSANIMVARLELARDMREAEVRALKDQVDVDPTTGLDSRARFMEDLTARLAGVHGEDVSQGAVMLVRVNDLVGINQRHGRERGDDLLRAVATMLRLRAVRLGGLPVQLARLNGADFAVHVAEADVTRLEDWLADLTQGLQGFYREHVSDRPNVAWVGAAAYRLGEASAAVMSRADTMLQRCETTRQLYSLATAEKSVYAISLMQWRAHLEHALETGQVDLQLTPVRAVDGTRLHHEASICMTLPDGTALTAADVIPPAERSGRIIELDLRALELALLLLAQRPGRIAVKLSSSSIGRPLFVERLRTLLTDAPDQARNLLLDVHESVLECQLDDLRSLSALARRHGASVGLDAVQHQLLPALVQDTGVLSHLKLHASLGAQALSNADVRKMVAVLIPLAQAIGCPVIATGVEPGQSLPALFALGFRGVTGSGVAEPDPLPDTVNEPETA